MLIDPKGHAFGLFEGLPHLARPVIWEVEEASEALSSLVYLMEKRGLGNGNGSRAKGQPHVVVVIDELADLLMVGGKDVQQALTRLTQRGREAGIHLIAATQKPASSVLGPLIKANFPVRLVGRMMDASDAHTATGWSGTGAERLMGRGDFLAVAEGRVIRFQVAHVSPSEIAGVMSARGWKAAPTVVAIAPPKIKATIPPPPVVLKPEPTEIEVMIDRLNKLNWDAEKSYRAAARALGEAEGGRRFALVQDAVDMLRDAATATGVLPGKNGGNGQKRTLPSGSGSTVAGWAGAFLETP